MNFKIVSDSSSNILEWSQKDYCTVPLKIILGEDEYVDNKDLDVANMVEAMSRSKAKCSTSCPNVFDWLDAFGDAKEIFAITITSHLSGSYSSALQAKEEYIKNNPNAKVYVIDSLSTGPEMQLIIEKLFELDENGATFEEAVETIKKYCQTTELLFSLESLRNLAKNGRVSPAVAKIAGVLGIRVVGKAENGELYPLHKCRGEKKAIETISEEILNLGFKGGKIRISHCQNIGAAEKIAENIKSKFPNCDIKIGECTALCSFYAEKGGLLIGLETEK